MTDAPTPTRRVHVAKPADLTPEQQQWLTEHWSTSTCGALAETLGLAPRTLRATAKALGLPQKTGGRPPVDHSQRRSPKPGCHCEFCKPLRRQTMKQSDHVGKVARWMYYFNVPRHVAEARVAVGSNLRVELSRAALRGEITRLPNGVFLPKPSAAED